MLFRATQVPTCAVRRKAEVSLVTLTFHQQDRLHHVLRNDLNTIRVRQQRVMDPSVTLRVTERHVIPKHKVMLVPSPVGGLNTCLCF